MLGVVKELFHPGLEIGQGAGDEFQVALRGGLEDLLDLEQGRLAEDGHHRGQTDEEFLHVGVGFRRPVLVVGAAEGGDAAEAQLIVPNFAEKILVLGVGAGPAAFDVMNAQIRQFLGDADFVGQGQVEVFGLGAVSQGGVIDFHLAHGVPRIGCLKSPFF